MKIDVDADNVMKRKADDRGRITTKPKFADKTVEVVVVGVVEDE